LDHLIVPFTTLSDPLKGFSFGVGATEFVAAMRDAAGVTDVDTFWFGSTEELPGATWRQTNSTDFSEGDSALAFSWQDVALAPGQIVVRSVTFGTHAIPHATPTPAATASPRASRSPRRTLGPGMETVVPNPYQQRRLLVKGVVFAWAVLIHV
jgi:hypothetical protein